eukprot:TRINITY_DN12075_c0_g1_i2.p1 TRINITY_DN12075_c0_g1~~TRINITY_DN12075_c0_g1_i2.p1  ORF type:complete len:381 (+),score=-64.29 TRINITY_DN12075_c0_g1_i2:169-1311(+)
MPQSEIINRIIKELFSDPISEEFCTKLFFYYAENQQKPTQAEKNLITVLKNLEIAALLIKAVGELEATALEEQKLEALFNGEVCYYGSETAALIKTYRTIEARYGSCTDITKKKSAVKNCIIREYASVSYQDLDKLVEKIVKEKAATPAIKSLYEEFNRDGLVKKISERNKQAPGLEESVATLRKHVDHQDAVLANQDRTLKKVENELATARSEMDTMRTEIDRLTNYAASTRHGSPLPRGGLFGNERQKLEKSQAEIITLLGLGKQRCELACLAMSNYETVKNELTKERQNSYIQDVIRLLTIESSINPKDNQHIPCEQQDAFPANAITLDYPKLISYYSYLLKHCPELKSSTRVGNMIKTKIKGYKDQPSSNNTPRVT